MRIAVSGSHATGKSTLVRELLARIPDLTAVDEAYYVLTDQGHVFADPPTFDDFEVLVEQSAPAWLRIQLRPLSSTDLRPTTWRIWRPCGQASRSPTKCRSPVKHSPHSISL